MQQVQNWTSYSCQHEAAARMRIIGNAVARIDF